MYGGGKQGVSWAKANFSVLYILRQVVSWAKSKLQCPVCTEEARGELGEKQTSVSSMYYGGKG